MNAGARGQRGLTYIETLLAMFVLVVALVPAMDALQGALSGAAGHEAVVINHHRLVSRLETTLAQPFADLDAEAQLVASPTSPTAYSDAPGPPDRVLVYLSRYDGDDADADGDAFTGIDAGLLWVRVAIDNTGFALETLTTP